jgi:hypothetical protein
MGYAKALGMATLFWYARREGFVLFLDAAGYTLQFHPPQVQPFTQLLLPPKIAALIFVG